MNIRMPGIRGKGRWLSAVVAASLAAGGIISFVAPGTAYALGPGKVCLYLAPSGAVGQGHVGFEFQEPGRGYWAGATETPSSSWLQFESSETTIHALFKNAMAGQHNAGYYTEYRCHSTSVSSVGAAITQAKATFTNGYFIPTNDCETKAVSIFAAYDSSNGNLWPGTVSNPSPNTFFLSYLSLPGINWGPIHYL
jgi:hypothetical protein